VVKNKDENMKYPIVIMVMILGLPFSGIEGRLCGQVPNDSALADIAYVPPGSRMIFFHDDVSIPASQLFSLYGDKFGLGAYDEMVLINTEVDQLGTTHYKFRQRHRGFLVDGGEMLIRERSERCETANGFIMPDLDVLVQLEITEEQALQAALDYIGAESYMWEDSINEEWIKEDRNDPEATYFPSALICIASERGEYDPDKFHLVYRFNINAMTPYSHDLVYVDAVSGSILKSESLTKTDYPHLCYMLTHYESWHNVMATYSEPWFYYYLNDDTRGEGIITYDADNGTKYSRGLLITHEDDEWEVNGIGSQVEWSLQASYDYYSDHHERDSFDDDGDKIKAYIHFGTNWNNAWCDGDKLAFGDGSVNNTEAGFKYENESGALDESFSDIFGTLIEFDAGLTPDWIHGEDDFTGGTRSLANPSAFNFPDTYGDGDPNWVSYTSEPDSANDYGGVHTNGSVQSHWFYLLCLPYRDDTTGTNHNGDVYYVDGIPMSYAANIVYRSMTEYLTDNSTFRDALDGSLEAARDLYGACGEEYWAVAQAWDAVGVARNVISGYTIDGSGTSAYPGRLVIGPEVIVTAESEIELRAMIEIQIIGEFHARAGSELTLKNACYRP